MSDSENFVQTASPRTWVGSNEGTIAELDDAKEKESGHGCVCTTA